MPRLKCLRIEGHVDDQMLELIKYVLAKSKETLEEFKIESHNSHGH